MDVTQVQARGTCPYCSTSLAGKREVLWGGTGAWTRCRFCTNLVPLVRSRARPQEFVVDMDK